MLRLKKPHFIKRNLLDPLPNLGQDATSYDSGIGTRSMNTGFFSYYTTDIVVFVIVVIFAIFGLIKGFTTLFLGMMSWVGAIAAAIIGGEWGEPYVQPYIETPWIASTVAVVSIFLIAFIILTLIKTSIATRIKASPLGPLDRSFGMVFSSGVSIILLSLTTLAISHALPLKEQQSIVKNSKIAPFLYKFTESFKAFLSQSFPAHYPVLQELLKPNKDLEKLFLQHFDDPHRIFNTVKTLSSPALAPIKRSGTSSATSAPQGGYDTKERHHLNRLVEEASQ